MFIAMNNFKVAPGRGPDFEAGWLNRETYLGTVPGFIQFALLRGDNEGEYISHTVWTDRAAFEAWTRSAAFVQGHRQGGSMVGILEGHPVAKLYESVMVQRVEDLVKR